MIFDNLMLHDDYEDFATRYLGVEYEDYVELLDDFVLPDEEYKREDEYTLTY